MSFELIRDWSSTSKQFNVLFIYFLNEKKKKKWWTCTLQSLFISFFKDICFVFKAFRLDAIFFFTSKFSCLLLTNPILKFKKKKKKYLGPVWLTKFHHSISVTQFPSLITHHSSLITHYLSLNFSHPFAFITQFPSLIIFHTIWGPTPVTVQFFFFFQYPESRTQ